MTKFFIRDLIGQCSNCKHKNQEKRICAAFTHGIPREILTGEFDHTNRHPDQDNDIVFEPIIKAGVDE